MTPQSISACRESASGDGASYNDRLRLRLEFLIQRCSSFFEVCAEAQGAFPNDVYRQLVLLGSQQYNTNATRILQTVADTNSPPDFCFGELENLLIDYDWRFDKSTAERLYRLLWDFESVLCMGTPTVFALRRPLRRQDFLVDQNPYYSNILDQSDDRIISEPIDNLNATTLNRTFSAVLLDPPWYLNSYEAWIDTGLSLLKPGGTMFLPIFSRLLRETAQWEIRVLLDSLASLGKVSMVPFRLKYETPTFETECLRRFALPPLHGWRSARLAAIRVIQPNKSRKMKRQAISHPKWARYRFGAAVVAIKSLARRESALSESNARLFFLDSVSERDSRRHAITAISSRNMATNSSLTSELRAELGIIHDRGRSKGWDNPLVEAASRLGIPDA